MRDFLAPAFSAVSASSGGERVPASGLNFFFFHLASSAFAAVMGSLRLLGLLSSTESMSLSSVPELFFAPSELLETDLRSFFAFTGGAVSAESKDRISSNCDVAPSLFSFRLAGFSLGLESFFLGFRTSPGAELNISSSISLELDGLLKVEVLAGTDLGFFFRISAVEFGRSGG